MRVFDYFNWRNFQFTPSDIYIGMFVILLILIYGFIKALRKRESDPLYKYYFQGLVLKITGAVTFAFVYAIYYRDGGDTIAYWWGAESLKNLFYTNFPAYLDELFTKPSPEDYFNHYNSGTGWPPDWLYKSNRHFFVCKVTSVICIFIPGSFLGVSAFMSVIAYNGIWKLYQTVCEHAPDLQKSLRIGTLFLPSVLFWCSGIMKDTIVLTGVCWIVYETNRYLRPGAKKNPARLFLRILIWGWLAYSCKPYIVIAFIPAWLLWMNYDAVVKIRSTVLKYYLLPIFILIFSVGMVRLYTISSAGSELAIDNVVDQAVNVRNDFSTNETYGENRYEATQVNKSAASILLTIPEATVSGLFRPFIWEARSPFILFSSIENLFILVMFLYGIIKLRKKYFVYIKNNKLLLFFLIYSVILAFIVGFTTIIFGALIRFKTAFVPYFVCLLIIIAGRIKAIKAGKSYSSDKFH